MQIYKLTTYIQNIKKNERIKTSFCEKKRGKERERESLNRSNYIIKFFMIKNRKSFISYKPINLYLKGLRHKHTKKGIYTYYLFIIYCVLVNIIIF